MSDNTGVASVGVWYWFTTALAPRVAAALAASLSAGESERAARFVHEPDRRDYMAAHALLRHALSWHRPSRRPDEWRFARDAHGKPFVDTMQPGEVPLTFNLSHARGLVACVVADGAPVGVDVERVAQRRLAQVTARERYTEDELQGIESLARDDRAARFTEVWTLREAYLKGVGVGLWGPDVAALSFSFPAPDRLECHRDAGAAPWEFALLTLEGYRMAVAVALPASAEGRWALSLNGVAADGSRAGSWTPAKSVVPQVRSTGVLTMAAPCPRSDTT